MVNGLVKKEQFKKCTRNGTSISQILDTWSIYMLTSDEDFETLYGKKTTKKRKLFNGFIRTDYYQYWGKRPPREK